MTDFLSGLLDRALERAPILERRRPSLFEPLAGQSEMQFGSWATVEQSKNVETQERDVESPAFQETHVDRPVTLNPRQALLIPPTPSSLEGRVADSSRSHKVAILSQGEETREIPILNRKKSSTSGSPGKIKDDSGVYEDAVEPPHKGPAKVITLATPHRAVEPIIEKEAEKPRSLLRPLQPVIPNNRPPIFDTSLAVSPARPVVAPTVKREQKSESSTRSNMIQHREPAVLIPKPVHLPIPPALSAIPHIRRTDSQRQNATRQDKVPPTPTIQVTIGRIEVRAMQTAAPPRAMRSGSPKLSLEDYLRSRSGGAR